VPIKRRVCKRCLRNRAERFFAGPKGRYCTDCRKKKVRSTTRATRVLETHYITEEETTAILNAQGGVCAITKKSMPYNLDIDHDHALERELIEAGMSPGEAHRRSIRGLLSKQANRRLLPAVRDDVGVLRAAIDYLEHGNERTQRILNGD
jgi:Recombination endonuclease VII